jgi:hypothetical protein
LPETVPEGLNGLTPEEKNMVYGMLQVQVTPASEGYQVSGILGPLAPLVHYQGATSLDTSG